jgi:hypothetical protein
MRRRRLPKARGQATVELAITTIVFVPLAMYVLFLDDLLRYKLNLDEVVFSAVWDYTSLPLENGLPDVSKALRQTYCDHTSAYNSHDQSYECSEQRHHSGLAAHECWLTGPGYETNRLKCTRVDQNTGVISPVSATYNQGGIMSCTAQLGVINYMIPQKVLSQFSQEDATASKKFTHGADAVHTVGKGLAVVDHVMLQRQTFGLLVDTWSLKVTSGIDPDKGITEGSNFYTRVLSHYAPYTAGSNGGVGKANDFADAAKNANLLSDDAKTEPTGDSLYTPHLAYDPSPGHDFSGHTSSGWSDSRVRDTHSNRQNSYFGMRDGDW